MSATDTLIVARSIAEMRTAIAGWRADGETIGLVPTMGALHEGHLSLVERAQTLTDRVVATIFVNPTQFAANEDLASYPRREARDFDLLRAAGVPLVFVPPVEEMYPDGFATTVTVTGVSEGLCGAHRPGHFAGVATIVTKLLLQALPDVAVFGEKDYQQLQVIRRLARDLDIPVRIEGAPTVRETDGLALSSRNAYLDAPERERAPVLYRVLTQAASRLTAGDAATTVLAEGIAELERTGFAPVEYLEWRGADTLAPTPAPGRPTRLLAAAWLGDTRLIDNVAVG